MVEQNRNWIDVSEDLATNLGFGLSRTTLQTIKVQLPHYQTEFRFLTNFISLVHLTETLCILQLQFKDGGMPVTGRIEAPDLAILGSISQSSNYQDLRKNRSLDRFFGRDRLVMALAVEMGRIDYDRALDDMSAWINDQPLARIIEENAVRVREAVPPPPAYSMATVQNAMWVLECEENCVQGSAFEVEKYGFVTNHHVVNAAADLKAFQIGDLSRKFSTKIVKSHAVVDLAIIEIVGAPVGLHALALKAEEAPLMSHVAVCGFPNYRLGDSGVLVPGLVIGHRPLSGVRRILTNASIVTGMSGGPAISANHEVIGVCVTGADMFRNASEKEDHSIIPAAALDLL